MENTHDFPVSLAPIYIAPGDKIPGKKAVLRGDNNHVLGVVSDNYTLLPHGDVIEAFRAALSTYDFEERIQVAKGGAHLFATYKLNAIKVEVRPDDIVSLQFVVKNSYDGSATLQIMLGAYRLVCSNGMVVGKQFFNFSQKHVGGNTDIKAEAIQERIGNLIGQFEKVLPRLQEMSRTAALAPEQGDIFTKDQIKGIPVYLLALAKEEYARAEDYTLWGVYNALTWAITHGMKKESPVAALNYGKVAWTLAQKQLTA